MAEAPPVDAQNFVECDNCDVRAAKHHCSSCEGDLCEECKDEHLRKKISKNHSIIPISLSRKQKQANYGICSIHHRQKYEFYCNDCQIPCCLICFKEKHVQHAFENIDVAFVTRKQALSKELREVNVLIPERENMLKKLRENYQAVVEKDDEIENEMRELAKMFVSKIQEKLNQNLQQVTRDRKTNEILFKKHEKDIVSQLTNLKEIKYDLNTKLEIKGGDSIDKFWDAVEVVKDMHIQPDVISFYPATFSRGNINPTWIEEQFGTYATTKVSVKKGNEICDVDGLKNTNMRQNARTKLIASFSSLLSFVYYIDIVNPTEIWISGQNQNIVLLDVHGKKLKEIRTITGNGSPDGFGVMQDGSVIYSDLKNKCIKRVTGDEKHKIFFRTNWHPRDLSVTKSGDILVSMVRNDIPPYKGKICRFGQNGKMKLNVDGEENGMEKGTLFISPDDICENVNGDICVTDRGKKQITIVFNTGQLKFTYDGHSSSRFSPLGICTDGAGHILVVNEADSSVHMLNQDGQFICFLLTAKDGMEDPNPLRVDSDGKLWLAERRSGIIKVYEYQ